MVFLRSLRIPLLVATAVVVACSTGSKESGSDSSRELALASEIVRGNVRLAGRLAPANGGFSEAGDGFQSAGARKALTEGELRARLPLHANDPGELVTRHKMLRMQARQANASLGVVDGGRIVYPKAFGPEADRIVVASETFVEEFVLLRGKSAGTRFSWSLEGAEPGAKMVVSDDGLRWMSANGEPLLNISRPFSIDSSGVTSPADLTWDEATHTMTVALRDAEGMTYPVLLDPIVEVAVWSNGTLPSFYNQDMAYDEARGEFVIPQSEKTALWRGQWRTIPGLGPRIRGGYGIAFDAMHSNTVLFGGNATGTSLNDTWLWDGATWAQAKVAAPPPTRFGASMAYDRARNKIVLFGGSNETTRFNDTWEWDGTSWSQKSPATSPSARLDAAMAYDEERGAMVLFGGDSTDYLANSTNNETWTWDGTNWTLLATNAGPSARTRANMAYDRSNKKIVLFGGKSTQFNFYADTWTLSGSTWVQNGGVPIPTGRSNASIGYDTERKRVVMLGGEIANDYLGDTPIYDSWEWDGAAWAKLPVFAAFPRSLCGAVYDPLRKNIVVFGGVSVVGGPALDETWVGDGASFAKQTPVSHPALRTLPALAFDQARGETILFGGGSGVSPVANWNETWGWNGSNWSKKFPVNSPPALLTQIAYDAERQNTVLFGGIDSSGNVTNETWTWDGTNWTKRSLAKSPSARRFGALTYDASQKRVVLFGGQDGSSKNLDDTWLWDGTTWTQVMPTVKPTARAGHAMTYDERRRVVLLWGGLSETDTWEWNGTTWSEIAFSGPSVRWLPSMVYDIERRQSVLIGGAGVFFSSVLADTWWLNLRGGDCSADSDCDTGHCVDNTCCNVAVCGTCQACNAEGREGVCSPVRGVEDKDSCAGANSCDPDGLCKLNLGTTCASAAECASGNCIDGVCCDTACKGFCQACRGDLKDSGPSGVCGLAKAGVDPHDDCSDDQAVSCQRNGSCDGSGRCEVYKKGTACGASVCSGNRAVGRVCDGIGACGDSTDGVECAPYVCDLSKGGCTDTCNRDVDCTGFSRCNTETHKCISKEGSSCDGDHTIIAPDNTPTDCGTYKCEGTECKTKCTSIADCVSPAVCTGEGKCVLTGAVSDPEPEPGCSCEVVHPANANRETLLAGTIFGLAFLRRRRVQARARGLAGSERERDAAR